MMFIVDIIRDVVSMCNTKLIAQLQQIDPLIRQINYEYGHYNDISSRILEYAKNRVNVYPLVCLFEDFAISHRKEGLDGISNLKIIILYKSRDTVTRQWREDNIFRPILYPIYQEFLQQLKLSGKFNIYDVTKIKHKQINRPHWGDPALYKNGGYLFNEILDGIELSDLELETFLKTC